MFSLTTLDFERPALLLFIFFGFLVFVFYAWAYFAREKKKEELEFKEMLHDRLSSYYFFRSVFLFLAWLSLCFALAGPRGNPEYLFPVVEETESLPQIFVIDTSYSMSAGDVTAAKSRLEYAADLTDELLKESRGAPVALYALSSQIQKVVPLSQDTLYTRLMVRGLSVNEGALPGTDFQRSFSALKEELADRKVRLVVLTDGGDHDQRTEEIAEELKEIHGEITFVGIGGETPVELKEITYQEQPVFSKMEREFLEDLVNQADVRLLLPGRRDTLSVSKELLKEKSASKRTVSSDLVYEDYFKVPLLAALLFLTLALFVPEVKQ